MWLVLFCFKVDSNCEVRLFHSAPLLLLLHHLTALLSQQQVIDGLFILRLGDYRGVYNAAWIGTLMAIALRAQGADYSGGIVLGATEIVEMETFLWSGFDWTAVAGPRLLYVVAALPFDRFDPSRGRMRQPRSSRLMAWRQKLSLERLTQSFYKQATIQATIERGSQLTSVMASPNKRDLFAQIVWAEGKVISPATKIVLHACRAAPGPPAGQHACGMTQTT